MQVAILYSKKTHKIEIKYFIVTEFKKQNLWRIKLCTKTW